MFILSAHGQQLCLDLPDLPLTQFLVICIAVQLRHATIRYIGLRFQLNQQILPAGTDSGALYGLQSPSLNRYCCARSHASRICGLALYGDGAASVSSTTVCYHAVGGLCHIRHTSPEVQPRYSLAKCMPSSFHQIRCQWLPPCLSQACAVALVRLLVMILAHCKPAGSTAKAR